MIRFFKPEEERRIIQAITAAEGQTSGEIRVHLAEQITHSALADARQVFSRLGMEKTEARNGVLLYIVPKAHRFALVGDEGIDAVVPDGFWDDVRDIMQEHFRHHQFCEGILVAIERIAEKLQAYFPHQGDDDVNELPDDISYDS
jgi:uncharacterized membrane protein